MAAFEMAGATEHGQSQFLWSEGKTMAAFKHEVHVIQLKPLTRMKRVEAWRVVERFEVIGATEHGPCSLLIYNMPSPGRMPSPSHKWAGTLPRRCLRARRQLGA